MKPSLFEQLIQQESLIFGLHTHPISTNVKTHLIPVAEQLLNTIPAYMPEYTLHNIKHCEAILSNINDIIPDDVQLNIVELTILIYSVYLHDIGMVINRNEAESLKSTAEFKKLFLEFDKDVSDNEILTEFIRRNHVNNSLAYIEKFKKEFSTYKIDFTFKSIDLSQWIKNVILSHAYPLEFIKDINNYPVDKLVDIFHVDVQFLSMLLRLGDILDFDIFRTPPFLYHHINPTNQISNDEWKKHQAIEGKEINTTTVRFDAFCKTAKIERLVREFTNWIELERRETIALLNATGRASKLKLNDKPVLNCRNDGSYLYTDLQLNLDYERVLNILMGTELYDSPDVFLREILQNAYDACKCRADKFAKANETYLPNINIKYSTEKRELKIEDNGIGIDKDVFEKYVITIGKSYYKSKAFQNQQYRFTPISNFGIGIISCFMVSDSIELESFKFISSTEVAKPIHYILNVDQKYIDERKGKKDAYGTTITLKLKEDYAKKLTDKSIVEIIKENMTYQEIPIHVSIDGIEITLNEKKIVVLEEYKNIDGVLIFELDKNEWAEGYMIIHGNQHQTIIPQSKVSQQCFTISQKNGSFPLQVPWLQTVRFFINILPAKKINLKASRNKIQEDETFSAIKNYLIEHIISQFKKQENLNQLGKVINDGRGNVFSGSAVEYDFLTNLISLNYFKRTPNLLASNFRGLINSLQGQAIAVIHPEVLKVITDKKLGDFLFKKYPIIILHDFFVQYFYQFCQPYINYQEIFVTDISGLVYFEIGFKNDIKLNVMDYPSQYSWHRDYDIRYKGELSKIFCIVGNNQYNSLDLKLNYKHRIGRLLKATEKSLYTKRFLGSFKTNVGNAFQIESKLTNYVRFEGENHYLFGNNQNAFSLMSIGLIQNSFIDSINKDIVASWLIPLANDGLIQHSDINDYLFSESDFPSWWISK